MIRTCVLLPTPCLCADWERSCCDAPLNDRGGHPRALFGGGDVCVCVDLSRGCCCDSSLDAFSSRSDACDGDVYADGDDGADLIDVERKAVSDDYGGPPG